MSGLASLLACSLARSLAPLGRVSRFSHFYCIHPSHSSAQSRLGL